MKQIPFYRKHTVVTALVILSFFVPFLFVFPILILITGEVYQNNSQPDSPVAIQTSSWGSNSRMILLVLLVLIGLFWVSTVAGGSAAVFGIKVFSVFFDIILALAFSSVIAWRFKRIPLWLKILFFSLTMLFLFFFL